MSPLGYHRKIDDPGSGVSVENPAIVPTHFSVDAFPNPFAGSLSLSIESSRLAPARIELLDLLGRPIRSMMVPAGEPYGTRVLETRNVPPGAYFLRIQSGSSTLTKVVVRGR
jgi:hypothetical protein